MKTHNSTEQAQNVLRSANIVIEHVRIQQSVDIVGKGKRSNNLFIYFWQKGYKTHPFLLKKLECYNRRSGTKQLAHIPSVSYYTAGPILENINKPVTVNYDKLSTRLQSSDMNKIYCIIMNFLKLISCIPNEFPNLNQNRRSRTIVSQTLFIRYLRTFFLFLLIDICKLDQTL